MPSSFGRGRLGEAALRDDLVKRVREPQPGLPILGLRIAKVGEVGEYVAAATRISCISSTLGVAMALLVVSSCDPQPPWIRSMSAFAV